MVIKRKKEKKKGGKMDGWMESRGEKGVETITEGKEGDRVGIQDRGGGKRECDRERREIWMKRGKKRVAER